MRMLERSVTRRLDLNDGDRVLADPFASGTSVGSPPRRLVRAERPGAGAFDTRRTGREIAADAPATRAGPIE